MCTALTKLETAELKTTELKTAELVCLHAARVLMPAKLHHDLGMYW